MIRKRSIRKSKRDDKITRNLDFLYHFYELINFCSFSKKYINLHFPRLCESLECTFQHVCSTTQYNNAFILSRNRVTKEYANVAFLYCFEEKHTN